MCDSWLFKVSYQIWVISSKRVVPAGTLCTGRDLKVVQASGWFNLGLRFLPQEEEVSKARESLQSPLPLKSMCSPLEP